MTICAHVTLVSYTGAFFLVNSILNALLLQDARIMARNCHCEWARIMLSVFNFGLGVQLQAKNTPLVDFGLAQAIGN